jgi:uncharacterized protein (TIGR03435 family)
MNSHTKRHVGRIFLLTTALGMALQPLRAQTNPQKKPSFEVVSIKPSSGAPAAGAGIGGSSVRGNRIIMPNGTLRGMLQLAYQHPDGPPLLTDQIVGGPNWIDSDRYEIQGLAAGNEGTRIPPEQLALMFQSMLEERFRLKAHIEARELPVYYLLIGKDGSKLKPSADQTPTLPPGQRPNGSVRGSIGGVISATSRTMRATAVPMSLLVNALIQQTGRLTIDKTNLQGLFDFNLQFSTAGLAGTAPPIAEDPQPSLFIAIQEQLGLRLESTKASVDVLVIESVQRPTEN